MYSDANLKWPFQKSNKCRLLWIWNDQNSHFSTRLWSEFKFALIEIGQILDLDSYEHLKFIKITILGNQICKINEISQCGKACIVLGHFKTCFLLCLIATCPFFFLSFFLLKESNKEVSKGKLSLYLMMKGNRDKNNFPFGESTDFLM